MDFRKLSFSEKNIIKYIFEIATVLIVAILVVYFSFKSSLGTIIAQKKWLDPRFWYTGIIFLTGIIFITILRYVINKVDYWLDNAMWNLRNAFKGNWGEKKTFKKLQEILGQEYKIYPNFKIPNKKFDNDAIIVGPKGIIAIEVKNIRGDFEFIGDETYKYQWCNRNECRCKLNEWQSPSKEIIRHTKALEDWLAKNNIKNIKIRKAILLVGNELIRKIEEPVAYVISDLSDLAGYIEKCYADPRFNREFCDELDKLFNLRRKNNQPR